MAVAGGSEGSMGQEWGTVGKMVGVGHWDGIPDRRWDGFLTHGGVPDRGEVSVMWWDTRHR